MSKNEICLFLKFLKKYELWKEVGTHGPLTTGKINQSKALLIKRTQEDFENSKEFEDKKRLHLQKSLDGMFEPIDFTIKASRCGVCRTTARIVA